MKPKLIDLYTRHSHFVSDKWSSYIDEYQRLFAPLQGKRIRLLEIGVQNGGSLEIWEQFFPKAEQILGCDVEQECKSLKFSSPKINVIVGDIKDKATIDAITLIAKQDLDIIIDDGSHISDDIVASFLHLFPKLKSGGLFVAEDLHCSYWPDFNGGLTNPKSSNSFFKMLVDVINYEHWTTAQNPAVYLGEYFDIPDDACRWLNQIHSIEFINSMCIIKKSLSETSNLGPRMVAGAIESVCRIKEKNGQHLPKH
ncbi:TPA: class I SAM-dependent methyltransferase [Pseudomonas putida]|uniref:class I SAM-dependent methyltransferase n=1 Tax=Pseudomonas putida TaxID=303 RepID=UPI000E0E079F|nr:class I SAM-dependent methyltransferase [Pseudomonas putida]MCE0975369.1 class I SAM-dependent methyltransferase [Pseudomonas putida]WQE55537.1 class I SAM-dependent methyltransferase [Pseudomonas putida]GLO04311.1 hypothetical protein PPUJ13061_42120 [Pseudomonas putida]HDS1006898.1 class I SAM-dependent methyltransferase [Pseudomonas putida]